MDVFVVKKVSVLEFALLIGRYAKGEADKLPRYVTHLNTAQPVELDFARTEVVNVDGEAMFTDKLVLRLIPAALKLIVPKGMRFFEDNSR